MARRWLFRIGLAIVLVLAVPAIVRFALVGLRSTRVWIADSPYRQFRSNVSRQHARPPQALAARSDDGVRYPRSGFGVIYDSGDGLRFDSLSGALVWDDRYAPDTTVRFQLPADSLDVLYELALLDRLFELAEAAPAESGNAVSDEWDPRLSLAAGGKGGALRVRAFSPEYPRGRFPSDFEHPERFYMSDDYKRLRRFQDRLDHMIVTTPGYLQIPLPRRKKGYPL